MDWPHIKKLRTFFTQQAFQQNLQGKRTRGRKARDHLLEEVSNRNDGTCTNFEASARQDEVEGYCQWPMLLTGVKGLIK